MDPLGNLIGIAISIVCFVFLLGEQTEKAWTTFAGGFLGYLAATGNRSPEAMRQAIIFGSVMASFTVESFSLDRLRVLDYKEIQDRFRAFKRLTHFEDLP